MPSALAVLGLGLGLVSPWGHTGTRGTRCASRAWALASAQANAANGQGNLNFLKLRRLGRHHGASSGTIPEKLCSHLRGRGQSAERAVTGTTQDRPGTRSLVAGALGRASFRDVGKSLL